MSPQLVSHLLGFMCQHPCRRQKEVVGGRLEHRGKGGLGWGKEVVFTRQIQSYCIRTIHQRWLLGKEIGLEEAPPIDDADPNFKGFSPPGDLPSLPLSVLLTLLFKRPQMMDDF